MDFDDRRDSVIFRAMNESAKVFRPSCVLFDFDGTMYSFDDVYPRVWRDLYDEHRQAFGDLEFRQFYDRIGQVFTSLPQGMDSDEEHELIFDEIKQIWSGVDAPNAQLIADYRRRSLEYMTPRAGLEELLVKLDGERIPWGIVSNHDGRNRGKFEAMGLSSRPSTFILSVEVGVWKPDRRIFEMALEEIGPVDRSAAVMVGDNPEADIGGGRSAGMRTVLMHDGPFATGHDGSADLTVTGFEELQSRWFDG